MKLVGIIKMSLNKSYFEVYIVKYLYDVHLLFRMVSKEELLYHHYLRIQDMERPRK
jgi:hypothetical protein